MARYIRGVMAGGVVGVALGVYFLMRSKRLQNIIKGFRFRGQFRRNLRTPLEMKSRGAGSVIKKGTRVFAKKLVR